MDDVVYHLEAGMLNIKLTSEKIIVITPNSNEAFALKSANGIGVIELIEEYNDALLLKRWVPLYIIGMAIGCFLIYAGFIFLKLITFIGVPLIVTGFICIVAGIIRLNKVTYKPELMSALRIIMSGGNRDFIFNKTDVKRGNLDEFVAIFESTLSECHKNLGK
jgi:hypothetical protein